MKAVFFDLDGTLCNTLPDLTASVNYALRTFDFPAHSEAAVCAMVGNGIQKLCERAVPSDRADAVPMVKALFLAHYQKHCTDKTVPYPGMVEAVAALKQRGLRLAVISNKYHPSTERIVRTLFPNGGADFDVILGQTDKYPLKPDPTALLAVAEQLGVTPQEIVYVGDTNVDIEFAKNAGVGIIGCAWGFRGKAHLTAHGAPVILDTPSMLPDAVE